MHQADIEHQMGSWHRECGHQAAGFAPPQSPTAPFLQFLPSRKSCSHQDRNHSLPLFLRESVRRPCLGARSPRACARARPVQAAARCAPASQGSPSDVSPQKLTPADKKPFLWPNKSPLLFFFLLLPSYEKGVF